MYTEENTQRIPTKTLFTRGFLLLAICLTLSIIGYTTIFNFRQTLSCGVFLAIILGTLFFWSFRLSIAFIGLGVLIFTNSLNIPTFVESAALPVILFLVGMMIIVGALRDLGFFTWVVQLIISMPNISASKFIFTVAVTSALLACAVDEVTSIIFISVLVFQVCDKLKLNPSPYLIICVLCTNVGSAGTMMGNPVGIFIGARAGLTFGDFMIWAFPIMLVSLILTAAVTMLYYRKDIREFDKKLKDRFSRNLSLAPKIKVPYKRGVALLAFTVVFIASHHQLEKIFGLEKNSILLIAPLICAGIIMSFKGDRARHYVEREVDWWTLLFFMFLFAIAGTLEHTHVTKLLAENFSKVCGDNINALLPLILGISALGSAFVDNVIFVAAFCPVIEELSSSINIFPLWWALLFGACFGGNITMIGSTANIVAIGMLEKRAKIHVRFFDWLKVGFIAAFVALMVVWVYLACFKSFMPDRKVPTAAVSEKTKTVPD